MAPAAAQKRLDLLDGKLGAAGADSVVLSRVHPMVVARRRRVPAIFCADFMALVLPLGYLLLHISTDDATGDHKYSILQILRSRLRIRFLKTFLTLTWLFERQRAHSQGQKVHFLSNTKLLKVTPKLLALTKVSSIRDSICRRESEKR